MDLREPVSALTHGFWAVAMILPLLLLGRIAWPFPKAVFGVVVYGLTMVFAFAASGYFHGVQGSDARVAFAQDIDHVGIHLFIAGSWTVFCLTGLPLAVATRLLGIIWSLALAGCALRIGMGEVPVAISTGIYLLMGWCSLACHGHLVKGLIPGELNRLWLGGGFFTVGAVINALHWPNLIPGMLGYHELFHLLVVAGSLVHFMAISSLVCRFRTNHLRRLPSVSRPPAEPVSVIRRAA